MATTVKGDERRGQDGDVGDSGLTEKKVAVETSYFEKLKERLNQWPRPVGGKVEPESEEPAGPGYVIYGDDGKPID